MPAHPRVAEPARTVRHALAWSTVVVLHLLLWAVLTQRPAQSMATRLPVRVTLRLLPPLAAPLPTGSDAPLPRQAMSAREAPPRAAVPLRAAGPTLDATAPGPQPITVAAEPPQAVASQPPLDQSTRPSPRLAEACD